MVPLRHTPLLVAVAAVSCPTLAQAEPSVVRATAPRRVPELLRQDGFAEYALNPATYDQCANAAHAPRMNRWRPLVWRIVGRDPLAFSLLMTFIFVESGGQQFAVSRSGCAGLMQFCDATALRPPFDRIFDLERLRSCACADRRCHVRWRVRRFLETTPRRLHPLVASEFPCDLFDARFDPESALRAGWAYISRLASAFDRNLYLVYIGYNSGPHVAHRVVSRIGIRRARKLRAIGRVLRAALTPNFGPRARRRSRSLVKVHLPKVARVYRAYRASGATPAPRRPSLQVLAR